MRRTRLPLWLAVIIGSLPAVALAQSGAIELRALQPTPFSQGYLRLDGPGVLPPWRLHAGVDLDYAWKSLVLTDVAPSIQRSRKTTYDFIQHSVAADLAVSMGIGGRFEVGALLPVTGLQLGDDVPGGVPGNDGRGLAGLGNAKLGGKARLLGNGEEGYGAGASVLVALPWGLGGGFIHEDQPRVDVRVFGELARDKFTVRAGAGYRIRHATQVFDIPVGDEITFAAGADLRVQPTTRVFAELAGVTAAGKPFGSTRQTPVELMLGARREVGAGWLGGNHRFWLLAAAGPGLTMGYGTPIARAIVALTWSNRPVAQAPPPPPPPPAPPAPTPPVAEKKPPSDRDKDGINDDDDECPDEPEDKDGFEDEDGCPDPDNDKDGILDTADKCPNEPETINGFQDDDGCPDKGETAVHVGQQELETLKPVFFETDHARVRHAFYNLLGQVALTLKAHPEIGRCAVEGHTDDTGPAEWNQRLSVRRAEAVVDFLVDKGVERSRLTAIGHGEKVPWVSNETEFGRSQNRRVIFHIEGANPEDQKKQAQRQRVRAHRRAEQNGDDSVRDSVKDAGKERANPAPKDADDASDDQPKRGSEVKKGSKSDPRSDGKSSGKAAGKKNGKSNRPPSLRDLLKLPEEPSD